MVRTTGPEGVSERSLVHGEAGKPLPFRPKTLARPTGRRNVTPLQSLSIPPTKLPSPAPSGLLIIQMSLLFLGERICLTYHASLRCPANFLCCFHKTCVDGLTPHVCIRAGPVFAMMASGIFLPLSSFSTWRTDRRIRRGSSSRSTTPRMSIVTGGGQRSDVHV